MRYGLLFLLSLTLYAGELSVEQLFNVRLAEVKEAAISDTREYYGEAVADEGAVHDVVLRTGGFVGDVAVDERFVAVKKGQTLFSVYAPEVYLAFNELINSLKAGRTELKESIVTKLRLLGVDEAVIKQAITSKKVTEYIPVSAPASGYVMAKSIVAGSGIKAGQSLYTIINLDRIWVEAEAYEKDLGFLTKGMMAMVRFDGTDKPIHAKLDQIYPAIDPKRRTVTIRMEIDNPEHTLFPGRFATVTLAKPARTALVIPQTAVITKGENTFVFVAGEYEGEYEPKWVRLKRLNDGRYEVLSGLEAGERVVDNSLFLFDSDAQINGLY